MLNIAILAAAVIAVATLTETGIAAAAAPLVITLPTSAMTAAPAHANPINIKCSGEGTFGSYIEFYRIDLNTRIFTRGPSVDVYSNGQRISDNGGQTYPIISITDQWITWSTAMPGAYQRLNRTSLIIEQMLPGREFEPFLTNFQIIKKQF